MHYDDQNMENDQVRTVHEARWVAAASEDFHPNPRLKVRTYIKHYFWSLPRMADPQSTKAMTRMTLKWIICHAKMWYRTDHSWHADLWVLKTVSFCGKHIFYFLWAEKKSGTFFRYRAITLLVPSKAQKNRFTDKKVMSNLRGDFFDTSHGTSPDTFG